VLTFEILEEVCTQQVPEMSRDPLSSVVNRRPITLGIVAFFRKQKHGLDPFGPPPEDGLNPVLPVDMYYHHRYLHTSTFDGFDDGPFSLFDGASYLH
jgi:hypothetical protein